MERASYELAAHRGRPDFILHISRLADIENRGVVPGLHQVYTLAALYQLNPCEIFRWYDAPLEECFHDGTGFDVPKTYPMAAPTSLRVPLKFDPAFDPRRTELLSRMVARWAHFEGVLTNGHNHHLYGYIGMNDRRMVPILRPGASFWWTLREVKIEEGDWTTEHDRPLYFVDVRARFRWWVVSPGCRQTGHAAASPVALRAGGVTHAGRRRDRRPGCGDCHASEWAEAHGSRRISKRTRRLEKNSSLR